MKGALHNRNYKWICTRVSGRIVFFSKVVLFSDVKKLQYKMAMILLMYTYGNIIIFIDRSSFSYKFNNKF